MNKSLDQLVESAKAAALIPATATPIPHENRPWPVVLLTGLGAWLAAVPLFGVIMLMLGSALRNSGALYVVGTLALIAAVVTLRSRPVPLFVEQLAVPALIVAVIALATALYRDIPEQLVAVTLALLALAIAWAIPQGWLRILLGAAAGAFIAFAVIPADWIRFGRTPLVSWLFASYATLFLWAGAATALDKAKVGRHGAAVEAVVTGWAAAIVLGCGIWAGVSLLDESSLREFDGIGAGSLALQLLMLQAGSMVLAALSAVWVARRWPNARQPWLIGVAGVLIGLSWMMPSLGAVLLVMALCATSGRWVLAGAGGVAVAWIVGAFYYQLSFPLATKAAMLAGAGLLLGAMAWIGTGRSKAPPADEHNARPMNWNTVRIGIVVTVLGVLGVANIGIWRNENLIATGQPVFVQMAPLDPRSLMQGDYMRLNFRLPEVRRELIIVGAKRPHVVAQLDARSVATLLRLHDSQPLAPGEFLIELTPKDGQWTLVTDAWFFKEGEAQRWERAKYGEFRVKPDGRALLVDLRGAALEKL